MRGQRCPRHHRVRPRTAKTRIFNPKTRAHREFELLRQNSTNPLRQGTTRVQGLGFGFQGKGFWVYGAGCRAPNHPKSAAPAIWPYSGTSLTSAVSYERGTPVSDHLLVSIVTWGLLHEMGCISEQVKGEGGGVQCKPRLYEASHFEERDVKVCPWKELPTIRLSCFPDLLFSYVATHDDRRTALTGPISR